MKKPLPEAKVLRTTKQAGVFFLSAILLLTALLWPWPHEAAWQKYQRAYLAETGQQGPPRVRQVIPRLGPDGRPADKATPELCLTCHLGLEEISPSHPVETFGCVLCHGGNGLSLDAKQAHEGVVRNPSDLRTVDQRCGQKGCHGESTDPTRNAVWRVKHSLQATYAGAIAQIRYSFGIQPSPQPHYGLIGGADPAPLSQTVPALLPYVVDKTRSPLEQKFAARCLEGGCHLTTPPTPAPYRYRATGCAACHVIYGTDGLYNGSDPTLPRNEAGHTQKHRFTTAIPFRQCNHCHNRGTYSLRTMTFTPRSDLPPVHKPLSPTLPDGARRRLEYYQPSSQFTRCEWELDCVDCHTPSEVMGDGHFWPNERRMQYIQCRTCHGTLTERPTTVRITDPEDPAIRRARLNGHYTVQVGDAVLLTERGEKLGNVQQRSDQLIQIGKVDGRTHVVPLVMGSACRQQPDQQEARYCHRCHSVRR